MRTILFALVFLSACREQTDTKKEAEKLMQTSREWSNVASSRDVEKVLNYWSDDAVVISAGQPVLKGKQAIRGMVESSFNTPGFQISWAPESVEISKSGDIGYMIEHDDMITNDSTGKPVTRHYKSVTIWKKQADGSWKNIVDVMSPESEKK
jgi:uncharacterized protein (TIGR02246 family)